MVSGRGETQDSSGMALLWVWLPEIYRSDFENSNLNASESLQIPSNGQRYEVQIGGLAMEKELMVLLDKVWTSKEAYRTYEKADRTSEEVVGRGGRKRKGEGWEEGAMTPSPICCRRYNGGFVFSFGSQRKKGECFLTCEPL
jgi:hypothetical protein